MPPAGPALRQGACFRFAVPAGWQIVEDGQFAVVMMAPDQRAITVMVGNAGYPLNYPPPQFLYEKLAQSQLQGLRLGQGRQAQPLFGWPYAWEFDAEYYHQNIPCRGAARCTVAPSYDCCTMVMSWAASEAAQWGHYAGWLPGVAAQVEITHPAAFGAAGIAQQNLANSINLGEQARRNREWSEQQWADVVRQRNESQDRIHHDFRQALDAVQRYENPYTNQPVDLTTNNAVYWINMTTGQIVGHPNSAFDPRSPTDTNWQPLRPSR